MYMLQLIIEEIVITTIKLIKFKYKILVLRGRHT